LYMDRLHSLRENGVDLNKEMKWMLETRKRIHLVDSTSDGFIYNRKFALFCFLEGIVNRKRGESVIFIENGGIYKVSIDKNKVMDFNTINLVKKGRDLCTE